MLDYIVIGQGIAGTFISYQLYKQKKNFVVIDPAKTITSSIIAAGIIDPITSRRNGKVWIIDELLEEVEIQYAELEKILDTPLFSYKTLIKPFAHVEEYREFVNSPAVEGLKQFIVAIQEPGVEPLTPYGALLIKGGLVNSRSLVLHWQDFLKKHKWFIKETFDYNKLEIAEDSITYGAHKARQIIFCEGYHTGLSNPYFKHLPFTPAKGEILDIETQSEITKDIYYKNIFLLPKTELTYRTGPTFERDILDEIPSEAGKAEILSKLVKIHPHPIKITDHRAGIRPTVIDRRPFIGLHPDHPQIGLFNGLGTKGVSLAPYFSKHFISHIEIGTPLNKEVNLKRYWKPKPHPVQKKP